MTGISKDILSPRHGAASKVSALFAAAAMATGVAAHAGGVSAERVIPAPQSPMNLNGFVEYTGAIHKLDQDRRDILAPVEDTFILIAAHRQELDKTITSCVKIKNCSPHVIAFQDMIKQVKKIHDPAKQLVAVNVWVNTAIRYDNNEANTTYSNFDHRTLVQSLEESAGICDEIAQLKLYALDKAGFPQKDMRFVIVAGVDKDDNFLGGHAVVAAHVGKTNWVLNNNDGFFTEKGETLSYEAARSGISIGSVMYDDRLSFGDDTSLAQSFPRTIPMATMNYKNLAFVLPMEQAARLMPRLRIPAAPSTPPAIYSADNDKDVEKVVMPAAQMVFDVKAPDAPPARPAAPSPVTNVKPIT